jgi:ADP-glucose pyrophosphorylase
MSIYTVPAGYSFYLDLAEVNTSNSYTSANIVTYSVQAINNTTGVKLAVLQQPFVSIYTANRSTTPFLYAEKTDIQWQLVTSTATTVAAGLIVAGKLVKSYIPF